MRRLYIRRIEAAKFNAAARKTKKKNRDAECRKNNHEKCSAYIAAHSSRQTSGSAYTFTGVLTDPMAAIASGIITKQQLLVTAGEAAPTIGAYDYKEPLAEDAKEEK